MSVLERVSDASVINHAVRPVISLCTLKQAVPDLSESLQPILANIHAAAQTSVHTHSDVAVICLDLSSVAPNDIEERGLSPWEKYPPFPDPILTPGDAGRCATTEPISGEAAREVLEAYGIEPGSKYNVVCRLVPAEMGGSNFPSNLFPLTAWFAEQKAQLDRMLAEEWRAGRLSIVDVFELLTTDWLDALQRLNRLSD